MEHNGFKGNLAILSAEFQDWCAAQGLPWESASDLRHHEGITRAQWDWLQDFIARWEAVEDAEDAQA